MSGANPGGSWRWLGLPGLLWAVTAMVHPTLPPAQEAPRLEGETSAPRPGQEAGPRQPKRLLYVWDATLAGDPARTDELLEFCARHRLQQIALEASPLGYREDGARERYGQFVTRAGAHDIEVLALGGCPWWTLGPERRAPGQTTSSREALAFYGAIADSGIAFAGVLDDSEPHTIPHGWWFEHLDVGVPDYLAHLRGVRERVRPLPLIAAVPFWFDQDPRLLLTDDTRHPGTLLRAVQASVDGVAVMDYRDRAAGHDGLVHHVRGELAGGPTYVGVETDDLGPAHDKVTFWEEGRAAMEVELDALEEAYAGHPNLLGIAIHHYGSLRRMRE